MMKVNLTSEIRDIRTLYDDLAANNFFKKRERFSTDLAEILENVVDELKVCKEDRANILAYFSNAMEMKKKNVVLTQLSPEYKSDV